MREFIRKNTALIIAIILIPAIAYSASSGANYKPAFANNADGYSWSSITTDDPTRSCDNGVALSTADSLRVAKSVRVISRGTNGGGVARLCFQSTVTSERALYDEKALPASTASETAVQTAVVFDLNDGIDEKGKMMRDSDNLYLSISDSAMSDGYAVTSDIRKHVTE